MRGGFRAKGGRGGGCDGNVTGRGSYSPRPRWNNALSSNIVYGVGRADGRTCVGQTDRQRRQRGREREARVDQGRVMAARAEG